MLRLTRRYFRSSGEGSRGLGDLRVHPADPPLCHAGLGGGAGCPLLLVVATQSAS